MPIYEYGCEACGHRFEVQQKLADEPLKKCPKCGKKSLAKLISPTAFVLKGSGWYKDGYGGKKSSRTETQRGERLEKAIADDKKKGAATTSSDGGGSSSSSSDAGTSSTPSSSGGDTGGGKSSAAAHTS